MSKKIKIIINPISGSGRGPRLLKKLLKHLDYSRISAEIKTTAQAGEATYEAQNLTGIDTLVCIGGDGTVNEVINGLRLTGPKSVPLAILPVGSGNVIAKELNLSRNIKEFIRLLDLNKTVSFDLGEVNFPATSGSGPRYFISMAGIGFDAEVACLYHKFRRGVRLQAHLFNYFPLGISTLLRYRPPKISIEVDGRPITDEACFIQVANARSYGGPFVFIPQARPDDGMLDILWFSGHSRADIGRYFFNAFLGNAARCKDAHHLRGKKVVLSALGGSGPPVPVQVDGDCCGYLPVEIGIKPQAVSMLIPE
ncbi:MAG: diacylglycerol kinase family protein [Planctomycetota bacterium]